MTTVWLDSALPLQGDGTTVRKILLWGGVLALFYVLRHLLVLFFMTFLLSHGIRGTVVAVRNRIAPKPTGAWLDRLLTVGLFVVVAVGLWVAGRALGPPLIKQAKGLIVRLDGMRSQDVGDTILLQTIGSYQFRRQYGGPGDKRYEAALAAFREQRQFLRYVGADPWCRSRFTCSASCFSARESRRQAALHLEETKTEKR